MHAESLLEAIAEIGVALAGFAGIVGALAGEKLRPEDPGLWLPFWVMISGGAAHRNFKRCSSLRSTLARCHWVINRVSWS